MNQRKRTLCSLLAAICLTGCASAQTDTVDAPDTTASPALSSYVWQTVETEPPVTEYVRADFSVLYANFDSVCRDADRENYRALTEAVLARKTALPMQAEDYLRVIGFFRESPLFALLSGIGYDTENAYVYFSYAYDEAGQSARVEAFCDLYALCISRVAPDPSWSQARLVLALYREAAAQLPFAYGEEMPLLECAYQGGLTQNALCEFFTFLLMGEGIPALRVEGENGVCWTAAQIDGAWYHFVPSYESMDSAGNCLWYFGMTDDDIAQAGFGACGPVVPEFWQTYTPQPPETETQTADTASPEEENPPETQPPETQSPETQPPETAPADVTDPNQPYGFVLSCTDTRFVALHNCGGWTVRDGILYTSDRDTGEAVTVPLDTRTDQ